MAFTQKLISVSFTSGASAFEPIGLSGLRMTCHAIQTAGNSMAALDLLIYGMTLSHMNQLSTLGWRSGQQIPQDSVSVSAGDENGTCLIYTGTIWQAVSDYQGGPNLPFHVVAHSGYREAGMNIQPTSINNKSADVANLMSQLAGQMGLQFENNGVSVKLAYPYLPGSARTQAAQLARHANIGWTIDRGTLAIWPQGGSRQGSTPLISPQSGMVGYPSYANAGIKVRCLFDPATDIKIAGQIQIQSSIQPANGTWTVTKVEHNLQSLTPNGEWFTTIEATNTSAAQPLPGISTG